MILRAARAALQGREHSSREGVLGSAKRHVFDETAAEAAPGGLPRRSDREVGSARAGRDSGRQRLRRKLGARSKTPQPGGTARRSIRSKLRQDRVAPQAHAGHDRGNPGARGGTGCGKAEAGGSPSSEASPGAAWVVGSGGPVCKGRVERRGGVRTRESGSSEGARIAGRLQKSVRAHLSRARSRSLASRSRDSLKRPATV